MTDDFGGWPDRATQTAVKYFPNDFFRDAFRQSLGEDEPRKAFAAIMDEESAGYPDLLEALAGARPDWEDVFDALWE